MATNQKGIDYMSKYNKEIEVWKDVIGYESYYQISNHGSVKSKERYVNTPNGGRRLIPSRHKKASKNEKGYSKVILYSNNKGKNYYVHRLVMLHFGSGEEKETVNHIDGDKTNNHISNLEWMTYSENNIHAIENGLNGSKQRRNSKDSLPVCQYDLQGTLIKTYPSMRQAERETGVTATEIGLGIRKGWKYGGFIWKFYE